METSVTRSDDPVKRGTAATYESLLNSRILPVLGKLPMTEIKNSTLKAFFKDQRLVGSPSTLQSMYFLITKIVESAVDSEGNRLYPQIFNRKFIDVPKVKPREQKAPVATPQAIQEAISSTKGPSKALYAILAGTGLRIGEALALMVGPDDGKNSFWNPGTATIRVRTTISRGMLQMSTKTEAGDREVDLAPELNTFLCQMMLDGELPRFGLLFTNRRGGLARVATAYKELQKTGLQGFHSLRRRRLTFLDNSSVPRGLVKFTAGHAAADTTERYIKSGEGIKERKHWAEKAGLDFQLEAR